MMKCCTYAVPPPFILWVILTLLCLTPAFAQPDGALYEMLDLRTATSKTWLNADGTRTAEISSMPIHYLDSEGVWQEIDTNLVPAVKEGFGTSVIKNSFKTHLAADAKGWHEIGFDDIIFSFTADAVSSSVGAAEGDTITYTEAWPSTDLSYKVLPTCIKEELILRQQPEVSEFRFIVNAGVLEPVIAGRGIDFFDSEGVVRIRIPGPFMQDADGELSDAVEATWEELPDGTIELTLQPDSEWLSNAAYPVIIDPTITIAPYMGQGIDSHYDLYIPTMTGTRYDTGFLKFGRNTGTRRDYSTCIRWDTSGIGTNAVVTDAMIGLQHYIAPPTTCSVGLKRITEWPWPSTTLPARGEILETIEWPTTGGYKFFTNEAVNDMVQGWIWGSIDNYGVEIDETTGASITVQCWPSEAEPPLPGGGYSDPPSLAPRLTFTYQLDTEPPTVDYVSSPDYENGESTQVDYETSDTDGGGTSAVSGVKQVTLYYKKGGGDWVEGETRTEAVGYFEFDGMTGDGVYYFDVIAVDNVGNSSAEEPIERDNTIYDITDPVVRITNPPAGEINKITGENVKLVGTATDNLSGIDTVELQIQHISNPTIWPDMNYDPNTGIWDCTWSNPAADDYTIVVTATDNAGNSASETRNVTVEVLASGSVVFVSKNGSDENDGLSWDDAKATIGGGIYSADYGDEIWVAEGTYAESITLDAIALYGGFTIGDTYREQRNWNDNETIIEGYGDAVIVAQLEIIEGSTIIDGFTIRGSQNIGIACYAFPSNISTAISHNMITGCTTGISCSSTFGNLFSPKISNNIIVDNASNDNGGGISCYYNTSPLIVNNTIVNNSADDGGGIYCYGSSPVISNNIIAFNSSGIYSSGGSPTLRNNNVYGNTTYNYSQGLDPGTGYISDDPDFADTPNGDFHIRCNSPCIDEGNDADVQTGWVDIDNQARIKLTHVDIGADEATTEEITLAPPTASAPCSSPVTFTAHVTNYELLQAVVHRIDVVLSAGSITSISPAGHIDTGELTGWGTTDSNGDMTITICTPTESQIVTLTVSIMTADGPISAQSRIDVGQRHVGFLYDNCLSEARFNIDTYLVRIDAAYYDVIYDRLYDIENGIDDSYDVVFVALPEEPLTTAELEALYDFVQSGREKRVVLLGEHNYGDDIYSGWYTAHNARLNVITSWLEMTCEFSVEVGSNLDNYDYSVCAVNGSHYLMQGIVSLCDARTDYFRILGDANELAYCNENPAAVWILEEDEDTPNAGSRIAIHDTNLMESIYNDEWDTERNKNFKFVHNLCTIFPE